MAGLGKSFDSDDDIISDINVTPLVDIALVLLIIFIVTSAIIVRAAINVDLPRAASAGEELPDSFSIVLDRQGELQFDGEPIERDQLRALVEARVAQNEEVRALIAADRNLDYGDVMDIIDQVRLGGVAGFSLNVERASGEK